MADLRRDGERGQLILIAGFVIAVSIVGLALIVNTAIFTENLATRSDTSGAVDALSYRASTEQGMGDMLAAENDAHEGSPSTVDANVQAAIAEYSELSGRQQASEQRIADLTYASSESGHRLFQNDSRPGGVFRSGDSDTTATVWSNTQRNWTLATTDHTREFRIGVADQTNLSEFAAGTREFRVRVEETAGSGEWWFNVTKDNADQVVVAVADTSGDVSVCRETVGAGNDLWVNVTDGTLAGADCEPLQFAEGISGTYEISFENSSNVVGNYSLMVSGSPDLGNFDPDDENPQDVDVLYSVEADLVYRTTQLDYRTTVRIAPGEPDA